MYRRARTGQYYAMPDENLQKILQDSKIDFLDMLDRLDARSDARIAADREKFEAKLSAEFERSEKRLAADREMAEARQRAAYERLAQERKEAERKFRTWLMWLIATFVSATIAMIGVVVSLLITRGGIAI